MSNTPRIPPNTPRLVEVLAYPAAQLLDVTGPLQVFATVNQLRAGAGAAAPYATLVVAPGGGSVTTSAGLTLLAAALPAGPGPDTLLVAGGPGVAAAAAEAGLLAWLRSRAAAARRVASVCTGAFLLAEAGLLDGRRATTHWAHCAALARRYPAVRVEPDPIFVRDGAVWSSAGVTAGIDLALALVEADLGRTVALAAARQLVMFLKRPGGQAQFSAALSMQTAEDRWGALHAWVAARLDRPIRLEAMASEVGMSPRSFSRHYTAGTGTTPARALERLRVEAAARLLAETPLPAKLVCRRTGFAAEETMRRAFLRVLGVGPRAYRARFGG
ncbi:MAG: GlxA family transcriptional regulator [Acetobacteraceae bacterium]